MATLYAYDRCDTCRKARRWLDARGIAYQPVDITTAPPAEAELRRIIDRSGLDLRRFFNTSGQSYRQGGWKERMGDLSLDDAARALSADGRLIKRPLLLLDDGAVLVGFDPDAWEAAFGRMSRP